ITAPATALLLRKEVAALSGVSQAELEALYEVKPVARAAQRGFQKAARTPPSTHRLLLQCLIAQPGLGAQVSVDWYGEGAEAEAVADVLAVLREADFALSSPALTQLFQGTIHEKTLATAEADMLHWGENFDVAAEFSGLLNKIIEGQRRQSFQTLQAKLVQGGLANLTDAERGQYLELLQRG
ncbi:MAG: DNA primase, partial [Gallionella sp.]|nr:DNA primase [Gallionella sp.]